MKVAAMFGEGKAGLVDKPDPKAKGEFVVVKIMVTPMCTEYHGFNRGGKSDSLGHEAAGEVGKRGADHAKRSREIGSDQFVEGGVVQFLNAAERNDACGVDEAVQAAESGDGRVHNMRCVVRLRKVELHRRYVGPEAGRRLVEPGDVATGEHHRSAAAAELGCDEAAEHTGAPE